jgi:glycosyltransferase involved in cell wall biosynthesis
LKISHFTSAERGGSGVLTLRLHRGLLKLGHNSAAYLRDVDEKKDEFIFRKQFTTNPKFLFLERLGYSLENRIRKPAAPSYFSRLRLAHSTPSPREDMEIVHLHWVGRWLDLPSFVNSLPPPMPIVWTVHDMSPLAGGCFTDFGCGGFEKGCGVCPLLKFPFNRILARQELKRRIRALQKRRVAFVANSESTMALLQRSEVASGKLQKVIPPGFDFAELKQISREEARAALGIPEKAFVLGFGAASLTDENKGIDRFYELAKLVRIEIPQTIALIFGDGSPEVEIPTRNLGILKAPEQLAVAYSAMDAHLVTSQMETFGQVSVEAQACGTPVFAFAVGGVPETLVDGKTGVLVPFGQCEEMAQQIVAAHQAGRLESMGLAGAEWVRGQFDSLVIAKKYVEVYEELLAGSARG